MSPNVKHRPAIASYSALAGQPESGYLRRMSPHAFGAEVDRQSGSDSQNRLSRASKVRQILELQQVLYNTTVDEQTKPLERASCARAWEVLEERLRILRGKPLPGQLQPGERPKRSGRRRIAAMTPESVAASLSAAA